ncbi:hypothetical protein pclt_cds_735 [Pandoravirus celtis]|uniref:Uncharacterized protein n=1 Tax=Pandoravirus celtis TaxID=2568002 RepID=A0A4D6EHZ8_9VIRU|nr:hypothetical protein pclt_cds_735 [Pandoravirus celtis]
MQHKDPTRRAIRVCLVAAVDKTDLLIEDDVVPYDYKASGQIEAIVRLVADGTVVLSRRSAAALAPRLSGRSPGRLGLVLSHRLSNAPADVCNDGALLVQSVDDAFTACVGDTLYVSAVPACSVRFCPMRRCFTSLCWARASACLPAAVAAISERACRLWARPILDRASTAPPASFIT